MSESCETCGAPVIFAWTPAGAQAIIDREPVGDGNTLLLRHSQFGLLSIVLSKGALERARGRHVPLRKSHWATCPDRADWRERIDARAEVAARGS